MRCMTSPATNGAAELWAPPTPTTGRTRKRWQRSLSIGGVIAVHIVGIVMFAARPLGFRKAEDEGAKNVVYLAEELSAPQPADARQGVLDMLESDAARQPRGDFVPPRLVKSSLPDPADYARRAGVAPGAAAHVVLAVKINELGQPAEVRVSSGSGNSRTDELAIEFAKNLRWNPATDRGAKTGAEIRLPVTLALPG
jgi:TonB family protein